MICKKCYNNYEGVQSDDFIKGVCLPCQVNTRYEIESRKDFKELEKYNQQYKTAFDHINSFCLSCENNEIEVSTLKEFPRLLSFYDDVQNLKKEQEYLDQLDKTEFYCNKCHAFMPEECPCEEGDEE